jgi:hypothetical protein
MPEHVRGHGCRQNVHGDMPRRLRRRLGRLRLPDGEPRPYIRAQFRRGELRPEVCGGRFWASICALAPIADAHSGSLLFVSSSCDCYVVSPF